ncbi:unnamed protein product [Caenorhabditis sp. 36 PRJEB53466]|nr:unnamed protein product [Caenorhabditis sp. 36 PRJEB53466]
MNGRQAGSSKFSDFLTETDYRSKSSDRLAKTSLEHKDSHSNSDNQVKVEELSSSEHEESSSYHPPDNFDEMGGGDFDESDDGTTTEKKETARQKFRRFRHKEYQCDECERMFTLKHNLQNHFVQYHMGWKTLHKSCPSCKCTICGKIYSAASVLAEHMLQAHQQSGETEECTICGERFITRTALKQHTKEHSRVLKTCPYAECRGMKFKLSKDLNEHVRLEHKLGELACSVCSMVFRQLSAKIKHEEEHEQELREMEEKYPEIGQKAQCDLDLVKRVDSSLSPPPAKHRRIFRPEVEAIPITKKRMKRLTKDEIIAKIKK